MWDKARKGKARQGPSAHIQNMHTQPARRQAGRTEGRGTWKKTIDKQSKSMCATRGNRRITHILVANPPPMQGWMALDDTTHIRNRGHKRTRPPLQCSTLHHRIGDNSAWPRASLGETRKGTPKKIATKAFSRFIQSVHLILPLVLVATLQETV